MKLSIQIFFTAFTLILSNVFEANGQAVNWIKSIGSKSTDMVTATALDPMGNPISLISFTNAISIESGIYSSTGSTDLLLIKYDLNGSILWSIKFGSNANDESRSVTTDDKGNIYITGNYSGAVFDYGSGQLTNSIPGRDEVFVIKISSSGNVIWAKSIHGNGIDNSNRICTDGSNVIIGGQTTSTAISIDNLLATSSYFRPAWLAMLDENGSAKWMKVFGSTYMDAINGICLSSSNIFIAGYFSSSTINFGNSVLYKKGAGPSTDMFVASLDLDGNPLWANSYGGNGNEAVLDLAMNKEGILYAGGYFGSNVILNEASLQTDQTEQLLIFSFDSLGKIFWSKTSYNSVQSRITSLSYHSLQGLIAGGYFSGKNLQISTNTLTSNGGEDGFIITIDTAGKVNSLRQLGQEQNDRINSVSIGSCTGIAGGDFMSNALAIDNLKISNTLAGIKDAVLARFSFNLGYHLPDTVRACGKSVLLDAGAGYTSYNWHFFSQTQIAEAFVSGIYVSEVYNQYGCKGIDSSYVSIVNASIVNHDTLLCKPEPLILHLDTNSLNSQKLLSIRWSTGENSKSIRVNPAQNTTYNVWLSDGITTCTDSVMVKVGTSVIPIKIVSDKEVFLCKDQTLVLEGNAVEDGQFQWLRNNIAFSNEKHATIESGGKYQLVYTNNAGCSDTSDQVLVNVVPVPDFKLTLDDNAVICNGQHVINKIYIEDSSAYQYQWMKDGQLILDANNASLDLNSSGQYKCIVTSKYGCTSEKKFNISIINAEKGIHYPVINTTKDSRLILEARNIGTKFTWYPLNRVTDPYSRSTGFVAKEGAELMVRIQNPGGCITVDTLSIRVFQKADIILPNAFTPNGDGKNDRIYPLSVGLRELQQFMIFDRWGKMIFKSAGSNNTGWNGHSGGRLAEAGTYVWMASGVLENGERIIRKGTFLLIK